MPSASPSPETEEAKRKKAMLEGLRRNQTAVLDKEEDEQYQDSKGYTHTRKVLKTVPKAGSATVQSKALTSSPSPAPAPAANYETMPLDELKKAAAGNLAAAAIYNRRKK